jgi:hypothetical protein
MIIISFSLKNKSSYKKHHFVNTKQKYMNNEKDSFIIKIHFFSSLIQVIRTFPNIYLIIIISYLIDYIAKKKVILL